jgi:raffinose/stachyose/melibiose transport system substrate-binding protein
MSWFRRTVALCAAAMLVLSGCSGGGGNGRPEAGSTTIDWWHIQNTDPMRPV